MISFSFVSAVKTGQLGTWAAGPFTRVYEAVIRVPDRLKSWEAEKYLAPEASYYRPFDPKKPVAIEIIDPGCRFCKKLTGNLERSGITERYNLSYLLYPIPVENDYKFPNSLLMARYIEAAKNMQPANGTSPLPADWQLIKKIFADPATGIDLQTKFNIGFSSAEAEDQLKVLLKEIGFTDSQILLVAEKADSPVTLAQIKKEQAIVENEVRTIKIPTLLISGRRFDQVVSEEKLREF